MNKSTKKLSNNSIEDNWERGKMKTVGHRCQPSDLEGWHPVTFGFVSVSKHLNNTMRILAGLFFGVYRYMDSDFSVRYKWEPDDSSCFVPEHMQNVYVKNSKVRAMFPQGYFKSDAKTKQRGSPAITKLRYLGTLMVSCSYSRKRKMSRTRT